MKSLLIFLKNYKKECVLAPLFKMLEASFELIVPLVVSAIIDVGIVNRDRGYIVKMCMVMVALGLISNSPIFCGKSGGRVWNESAPSAFCAYSDIFFFGN